MVGDQRVLRGNQIGVALRHLGLILLDAQDGQRADLDALVILIKLRLGQLQRLLLHLHVFQRVNQFVIGILNGGDTLNDLLPQALFGVFQPVFGNANVQARGVHPEIFQQRLGKGNANRSSGAFRICRAGGVGNVAGKIVFQPPRQRATEA